MNGQSSGQKSEMIKPQSEAPEEGLHVVEIQAEELNAKIESGILSLPYSALDTSKNKNIEARKHGLKESKLRNQHLKNSAHGAVLVAKDGEKIIGVLTLNRENGMGTIDDIYLEESTNQDRTIKQLLMAAKEHLQTGASVRCESAVINATNPDEALLRVYREQLDNHSRQFFILAANDNDPSAVLENGQ